jgi:hypothetical protein
MGGGKFSVQSLRPGKTWSINVYLQRFTQDLSPGTHNVNYSIDALCNSREGIHPSAVKGKGSLQVVILSSGESQLAEVLAQYAKSMETLDYWTRRSAEEALEVTHSALVLPYLKQVIAYGLSSNSGVEALAKLQGVHEAEDLLIATIRSGSQLFSALAVLEEWNYTLPVSDFKALLDQTSDPNVKRAAFRYAEQVHAVAYIGLISAYSEDPNALVASAAKDVLKKLNGSQ